MSNTQSHKNKKGINNYTHFYKTSCAEGCDHHGGVNLPKDGYGNTVLHLEILQKNYIQVQELVNKRGANVNIQNENGDTALHIELKHLPHSHEIITLLIEHRADVNKPNKDGNTPLHLALKHIRYSNEIIKLLIQRGADVTIENNQGESALSILASKTPNVHHNKTAIILTQNIKNQDNKFSTKDKIFKNENKNPYNFTKVDLALSAHDYKAAAFLIEKGADIHDKDKNGNTPLHIALKQKAYATALLLITKGADIHSKNNNGDTPLHIELTHSRYSNEIIKLLIQRGADVNIKNDQGESALSILTSKPSNPHTNDTVKIFTQTINNQDNKQKILENTEHTEEILPGTFVEENNVDRELLGNHDDLEISN